MDIDFVILWVDGNDPAWQAEKENARKEPKMRIILLIAIGTGDYYPIGFGQ